MRSLKRFILLLALMAVCGCQTPPTRVRETKENRLKGSQAAISSDTILIDARPPFQASLAKPSGATLMQWTDFTQREAPFEAYLVEDLFFHARRLARLGIGLDADVLVLGNGIRGEGEEGRLAWTLRRMGLSKVRFAAIDSIDWPSTHDEAPARDEVPIWKPVIDSGLEISRKEALALLKKKSEPVWVLDVRPSPEYLKEGDLFSQMRLHATVINTPWTEFLDSRGQLQENAKEKVASIGIGLKDRILVIDEGGVRSAGTTLLLREMGFSKATHWTGGYRELRWFLRSR